MQNLLKTVAIVVIIVIGEFGIFNRVNRAEAGVVVNVMEHSDVAGDQMEQDTGKRREVPKHPVDQSGKYTGAFDPACSMNLMISPMDKTVEVKIDSNITNGGGTTCHWNIFGIDDCVPVLTCNPFRLQEPGSDKQDPCAHEYMLITDGSYGYQKFCGSEGPVDVTSGRMLRDFYITIKLAAQSQEPDRAVKCTVTCSNGNAEGKALVENSEPDKSDDCNCGRKPNMDRIVGGADARRGEFPWMAALVAPGTRKPFCGGSVINNRFVLTAAHCLMGSHMNAKDVNILLNAYRLNVTDIEVVVGQNRSKVVWTAEQLAVKDKEDNSYRFTIDRYFIHPLYNMSGSRDFDVGLIKLNKPIKWKVQKGVSPVCFPKGILYGESKAGVNATVAGWGINDENASKTQTILQKLDVSVFPHDKCSELYPTSVTPRMMCAGVENGGKSGCMGDSGGALISEKSKQVWEQIGHVIFGGGCAKIKPTVFINSRKISQWVRYISNLEDAVWCHGN